MDEYYLQILFGLVGVSTRAIDERKRHLTNVHDNCQMSSLACNGLVIFMSLIDFFGQSFDP